MAGCSVDRGIEVDVSLETTNQTREQVFAIVDALLRQNGAIECGIMGHFSLTLGEGSKGKLESDPGPELKKLGVISLKTTAAH